MVANSRVMRVMPVDAGLVRERPPLRRDVGEKRDLFALKGVLVDFQVAAELPARELQADALPRHEWSGGMRSEPWQLRATAHGCGSPPRQQAGQDRRRPASATSGVPVVAPSRSGCRRLRPPTRPGARLREVREDGEAPGCASGARRAPSATRRPGRAQAVDDIAFAVFSREQRIRYHPRSRGLRVLRRDTALPFASARRRGSSAALRQASAISWRMSPHAGAQSVRGWRRRSCPGTSTTRRGPAGVMNDRGRGRSSRAARRRRACGRGSGRRRPSAPGTPWRTRRSCCSPSPGGRR